MLPYKTGFRYPIGFRGSAGFGFGDGFSPESVFGWVRVLSWIFGFGWPDTPPDPNPPHCRPYVTRWPITKTLSLMSQKVKCGMQMLHNMQVSHNEVHEWVSSILKDSGFCPGEIIDAGKLCPYKNVLSEKGSPNNHGDMVAVEASCQHSVKKVVRNKTPRGWELKYTRRSFFPILEISFESQITL